MWGGGLDGDRPEPAGERLLGRAAGLPAAGPPGQGADAVEVHAWIDRAMAARAEAQDVSPACRRGCSACCLQAVGVYSWEADRLAGAVAGRPGPVLAGVASRVAAACAQGAAILDPWPGPDGEGRAAWRLLGRPCPLLDPADGSCLVHAARPAVCRAHNVVVGPEGVCDTPGASGMAVPYLDILAEAGRLAGTGRRWLPLALERRPGP